MRKRTLKKCKKGLGFLLALAMVAGILPGMTLVSKAATPTNVYVAGVKMENGKYLAEGATVIQDEAPEDNYAYLSEDGTTLTFKNYDTEGKDNYSKCLVYADGELTLDLQGENTLNLYRDTNGQFYAVKTMGTLTIQGGGSVSIGASGPQRIFFCAHIMVSK